MQWKNNDSINRFQLGCIWLNRVLLKIDFKIKSFSSPFIHNTAHETISNERKKSSQAIIWF